MAEQRPAFRFRLPWLLPSEPATPLPRPLVPTQTLSQPPTTNQTPIPSTPAQGPPITTQTPNPTQRPLFRPSGLAPTQSPPPPPPPPAPIRVDSQSTTIKNPDNKTPEPSNVIQTPSPATPYPRPPFRPPGVASSQPASSQAQVPPRTESQPSSPSHVGTQSRVSSQPAPPSQSRVSSQPASPSQSRVPPKPASPALVGTQSQGSSNPPSTSQSRVSTKPASPSQSRVPSKPASPSQSRVSSQPASPSRVGRQSQDPSEGIIQSRTASQTSSISRTLPSQAESTRSPSRLVPQPTVKVSPKPSSPAKTSISMQAIEDSVKQPPSSITLQQVGQATTPPSFIEPQPPIVETLEPKPEESPLKSQDPQPNTQDTSNVMSSTHNSHNQTSTTTQPNVLEAKEARAKTQKSDSTPGSVDSAFLDDKPKEKKEAEVKKTKGMSEYGETEEKTIAELLTEIVNSKPQTKEQLSFAIQSEQKQSEKQLQTKEKLATSVSNRQQSKTNIAHQMDKSSVSESHKRPVTSNGAQASLHKEIKDDISKFVQKMTTSHSKNPMDEKSVSVITIAGENRGASMHLGSEVAKGSIHIRRGYKINPDESGNTTTDGEGSSRGRRLKDSSTKEDKETKAYVNSNNQGVNNAIVFDSSIFQRNPGVHLAFTRARTDPIKSNNKTESLETRKSEVGITPAQKLTYEPVIRRRCLRGLFLEPSDSDDDNPQKPRRHGCRYSCGEKNKDGERDVL